MSADAFRKQSKSFVDYIKKDEKTALDKVGNDLGFLIASATQIALAIELNLKALLNMADLNIETTHNLLRLYKRLPQSYKAFIEQEYNKYNQTQSSSIAEIELAVWITSSPHEKPNKEPNYINHQRTVDIQSVLNRSKDAFVTWRYIHEKGKKGEFAYFRYEFERLHLICSILYKLAAQLLHALDERLK